MIERYEAMHAIRTAQIRWVPKGDPVRSKYSYVLKLWVMALPAPNGLGKTLRTHSEPCNVVLRPFRMFSLR
jgi:hypothetical protein